jgi:hypothetical protein
MTVKEAARQLQWRNGIGLLEVSVNGQPPVYDEGYWEKYERYAQTELGKQILAHRLALVEKYASDGMVTDIGIGCGAFIEARGGQTYGYDVNPQGIKWLWERARWLNPTRVLTYAVTFWDSLEHMRDPGQILQNVTDWVILSIPIFRDRDHCEHSKHFRPDEHCWYFTVDGLDQFMAARGFRQVHHDTVETDLGREDIHSFVYRRIS